LAVWLWFAQVDTKVFVDVDAKKVGNLIGPKGATLHKIQVGLPSLTAALVLCWVYGRKLPVEVSATSRQAGRRLRRQCFVLR
jgi:hypothetical protein